MEEINNNEKTQSDNFQVFIRIRPPLAKELECKKFIPIAKVTPDKKQLHLYEYYGYEFLKSTESFQFQEDFDPFQISHNIHPFSFDFIHDENSSQQLVYEQCAKSAVISTLQGFNSTIIAYGQTGTGKTFTMEGGIMPRSAEEIFKYIHQNKMNYYFTIKVSYLQVYNETIQDLLATDKNNLVIREDKKKGVFVEGLTEWTVRSVDELLELIKKGSQMRITGTTKMNDISSRSHAIFTIIFQKYHSKVTESHKVSEIITGKLNFVDLAGSERVRMTGATGKRLEETKKINQSLSALGNVISSLSDPKGNKSHIPYRDSKLTRILEDSLGGNCKTVLITMISPLIDSFFESMCSLKFASRAKNIKNTPKINQGFEQKPIIEPIFPKNNEIKISEEFLDFESQIQNYDQIIRKQKEIMMGMTENLREKEETITRLQNEIDIFDKIHQETKEALNKENIKVQMMEKLLKKNGINFDQNPKIFMADFELTRFSPTNAEKQYRNSQQCLSQIVEIKKLIDTVICDLSTPNEPIHLQNVADDILRLQKLVDKLLEFEQKGRKNNIPCPLSNITNTIDINTFIKKKSPMNINRNQVVFESFGNSSINPGKKWKDEPDIFSSKENIFNIIPLKGEINIHDLINS